MSEHSTVYLDYTQSELNAQYDQFTLVPDLAPYLKFWTEASKGARNELGGKIDVRFGSSKGERLDIFGPTSQTPSPIHVHIHGGGWRMLTKAHASYPAPVFVAAGAFFVAPDHGSANDISLDQIVRQVRAAVAWAYNNADDFGGDRDRLYVSGHSSGAHLAAMVLCDGWRGEFGLPENAIKGGVVVSGIYDLEPVRLSARNDYLRLDISGAHRNSPVRHIPQGGPPIFVAWGGGELDEFKRQGIVFARSWRAAGNKCQTRCCAKLNHFDMSKEFSRNDSPIFQAALRQMFSADQSANLPR